MWPFAQDLGNTGQGGRGAAEGRGALGVVRGAPAVLRRGLRGLLEVTHGLLLPAPRSVGSRQSSRASLVMSVDSDELAGMSALETVRSDTAGTSESRAPAITSRIAARPAAKQKCKGLTWLHASGGQVGSETGGGAQSFWLQPLRPRWSAT